MIGRVIDFVARRQDLALEVAEAGRQLVEADKSTIVAGDEYEAAREALDDVAVLLRDFGPPTRSIGAGAYLHFFDLDRLEADEIGETLEALEMLRNMERADAARFEWSASQRERSALLIAAIDSAIKAIAEYRAEVPR